jgi:predicted GNAT family N-acyltransferase
VPRGLRGLHLLESRHPREPHFYLQFAGVAPGRQGLGIGSALLRPVLDRCDAEAMPAYLEATSPRNRAFYERHGFEVTDELVYPKGPPTWPMWRRPRRGGARLGVATSETAPAAGAGAQRELG